MTSFDDGQEKRCRRAALIRTWKQGRIAQEAIEPSFTSKTSMNWQPRRSKRSSPEGLKFKT
jgi:hypothetical protein